MVGDSQIWKEKPEKFNFFCFFALFKQISYIKFDTKQTNIPIPFPNFHPTFNSAKSDQIS